jgi:hypothetical protein
MLRLRLQPCRWVLVALCVGTLMVAGVVSVLTRSALAGRYASVALPGFLGLVALGTSALPGRARAATLAVVAGLGLAAALPGILLPRTQAPEVARALAGAAPGDLVVFCPDQLGPSVSRLAPQGLDLAVFPDLRPADRVDWTDYVERNNAVSPEAAAAATLRRAAGSPLWLVTGQGSKVPSDDQCRSFADALAAARGPGDVVVPYRPDVWEGERLLRFAGGGE